MYPVKMGKIWTNIVAANINKQESGRKYQDLYFFFLLVSSLVPDFGSSPYIQKLPFLKHVKLIERLTKICKLYCLA